MSARFGHPDDESAGPVPHGALLTETLAKAVPAAGVNIGPYTVAAYPSVVVAINNVGAFAMTATVYWDFEDSTNGYVTSRTLSVPVGATKRAVFQNQGDIIAAIRLIGVGGDTTADVYAVGSNLVPPSGAGAWAMLYADTVLGDANQLINNNAATYVNFARSLESGSGLYGIDVATDTITINEPGLYEAVGAVPWPGGAVGVYHYAIPVNTIAGTSPSVDRNYTPGESQAGAGALAASDEPVNFFVLGSGDVPAPVKLSVYQLSGVGLTLSAKRHLLVIKAGPEPA